MTTEAEQFFYDNAGCSYGAGETPEQGRARCARMLAAAEKKLIDGPYLISHEPDPEPWDGDEPYDGPLWTVSLWTVEGEKEPVLIGAIGSVACEELDPYMRVVAAELAAEYIREEKNA